MLVSMVAFSLSAEHAALDDDMHHRYDPVAPT